MMDKDSAASNTSVDSTSNTDVTDAVRHYPRLPRSDLRKMAIAQGIDPDRQWERLQKHIGIGKDFWKSETEFDQWLADIYARRKEPPSIPNDNLFECEYTDE